MKFSAISLAGLVASASAFGVTVRLLCVLERTGSPNTHFQLWVLMYVYFPINSETQLGSPS